MEFDHGSWSWSLIMEMIMKFWSWNLIMEFDHGGPGQVLWQQRQKQETGVLSLSLLR